MRTHINVGIIGTGVGIRTLVPGFRRTGRARITALSGSSMSRVRELAGSLEIPLLTDDHREVCGAPDVDLICVTTPNDLHLLHSTDALATGKHVYLEKPTGRDAVEGQAIARLVGGANRLVIVGHQLRFNPYFRKMSELIRAGDIGRVYHFTIAQHASGFASPDRPWTWEFEPARGGGVRLAMGPHLIDLTNFILGQKPVAIAAALDPVHHIRRPNGSAPRDCLASNFFAAFLRYRTGSVHVSTTAAAHAPPRFDLHAYGETGDLTFDLTNKLMLHRSGEDARKVLSDRLEEEYRERAGSSIFSTSFSYFAEAIVDAILDGSFRVGDAATVADSVAYLEVLDAALASYQQGTLEELRRLDSLPYY